MVESPGDYTWSSYQANGLELPIKLCTPHPVYLSLGATATERAKVYRGLFLGSLDVITLKQVREATNRGMVLGGDQIQARSSTPGRAAYRNSEERAKA